MTSSGVQKEKKLDDGLNAVRFRSTSLTNRNTPPFQNKTINRRIPKLSATPEEMLATYKNLFRDHPKQLKPKTIKYFRNRCFRMDLSLIFNQSDRNEILEILFLILKKFASVFVVIQIIDSNESLKSFPKIPSTKIEPKLFKSKKKDLKGQKVDKSKIGAKISANLSHALLRSKSLKHLQLVGLNVRSFKNISHALKDCESLQTLSIEYCSLGDKNLTDLLQCLYQSSLVKLQLSNCQLTENSGTLLRRYIMRHSLRREDLNWKLSLRSRTFADEDAQKKGGLLKLDLSNNELSDEGIREISEGLSRDKWLQEINLENNKITNIGAKYLLEMLNDNTNLSALNVKHNNIDEELISEIETVIEEHHYLCGHISRPKSPEIFPFSLKQLSNETHSSQTQRVKKFSQKKSHKKKRQNSKEILLPNNDRLNNHSYSKSNSKAINQITNSKLSKEMPKKSSYSSRSPCPPKLPKRQSPFSEDVEKENKINEMIDKIMEELKLQKKARKKTEKENAILKERLHQVQCGVNGTRQRECICPLIDRLESAFRQLNGYIDLLESHGHKLPADRTL